MLSPAPPIIMNDRKSLAPQLLAITLCGLALVTSSCRKHQRLEEKAPEPVGVVAPELRINGLGALPGAVYQSQAASPVHWQPWTKVSLARAKDARRLVFCVIAMPQQPGFQKVLAAMEKDPAMVAVINDGYVPILVDGDASREMGLLTADLCAEIKRPLQLPMFVWMTHEANPVAWIPVSSAAPDKIAELFNQSHTMVSEMWKDSSSYVLKNSALDNANRRQRLAERKVSKVTSEQPAVDAVRSVRQLASLYDPYSRSFDEAGGLFPASSLELLATGAIHPGMPADVRARCLATTRELLADLLPSAMFDPLDGGVFSSRRGLSWAFPSHVRDCQGQARAIGALIKAYNATGDSRALEMARGVIAFSEKSYTTPEGLFAVGLAGESEPALWMWSVEDIEKELGAQDAAWWIKATGMKGLGNLPSEVDPHREFFRANTMGLVKTMAEIAADQALPVESFAPRFEAAKAKLLAAREARLGTKTRDQCPHAGASFRMVAAYAAAFGATGDERFRDKAVALLKHSREVFSAGPRLRMFATDAPDSIGAGRAFLYALALQAVLDVAAITSDEQWLVWSEDLATTAGELFTGNGAFLKECPDEAQLVDLPVTDLVMLFDDSTAGLISSSESRLAELGRPLVASFSQLATPLPTYTVDRPILHTDLLLATLARHYKLTVVFGTDLAPAMKSAIERLPLRVIHRRPARPADQVPAGSVRVVVPGDEAESRIVSTPEALQEALLPSAAN